MSGVPNPLSSYLKYLPAIYGLSQDGNPPFVGSYLKVFEKIISGIPEAVGAPVGLLERKGIRELLDSHVFGTLFHPRLDFLFDDDPSVAQTFIPLLSTGDEAQPGTDNEAKLGLLNSYIGTGVDQPIKAWLHGFLNWFSGTIALNVDHNWSIDSKRFLIAQALPLFRARGTAQGMEWLLNAWFGVDRDAPAGLAPDGGLGLVGFRVYNDGFLPIRIEDSETGTFRLESEPPPGGGARLADIVCQDVDSGECKATGYRAWHFVVSLLTLLPTTEGTPDEFLMRLLGDGDQATLTQLERDVRSVVDEFKPALTDYCIVAARVSLSNGPPPPPPPKYSPGVHMSDDECQPHDKFARLRYRPGMYLTADDMAMEQNYLLHKLASINKALFEPGIVGGPDSFAVTVCEHDAASIEIGAGNAIDPDGILLEFGGTHAPLPVKSELEPLPEEAPEDVCYVYARYRPQETGEFCIADGVQFIFSRSPQTQGVLLAKLLFEEDRVAEVKTDSSCRCYAASRLFSTR